MQPLTTDDVTFYRREGYFLPAGQLFAPERFAQLKTIFEEHLADKGEMLSDELDTPHFRDPRLLEFLLSDEPLDLVEPIIGPNIALWSSHFISKEPRSGRATPWHEDSAFWEGRLSSYDKIVTVWLALDGSDRENGCMRVIPGTHLGGGFSEYSAVDQERNTFDREIAAELDESRAVNFELQPGEVSLHDGRIVHGAGPNASVRRRAGYTMRYFAADVRVIPERNEGHRVFLARGEDLAGNEYANH